MALHNFVVNVKLMIKISLSCGFTLSADLEGSKPSLPGCYHHTLLLDVKAKATDSHKSFLRITKVFNHNGQPYDATGGLMGLELQSQGQGQQNSVSMWETQHTVPLSRSERGMGMGQPSEMPAHGTNSVIKLSFNIFYFMFYW